jgi:hypothetical protein
MRGKEVPNLLPEGNPMNDRERFSWLMAVCLLILARPIPPSGDAELDEEWSKQRDRLLRALPISSDFRKEAP